MNTKKTHTIRYILALILIFSLLLVCARWGVGLLRDFWRDYTYASSQHTAAEKTVKQFADQNGLRYSDYPESLIQLLERNPETEEFVLNYPLLKDSSPEIDLTEFAECDTVPLFLQWDPRWGYLRYGNDVAGLTGCGPVCLAMAGYYVTGQADFSPDQVISYALKNGYCIPGNGTSWSLISEGGTKLGLDVTEIPLDKNQIFRNLEAKNPIICVMGPGDFTTTGHYIVMTGITDGLINVNDPNSKSNSQKLWSYEQIEDQIRNLWAIRAMDS